MFQIATEIKAQHSGTWEYLGRVGDGTLRASEADAVRFDTLRQAQLQAHYLRQQNPGFRFVVVDRWANTMSDGDTRW